MKIETKFNIGDIVFSNFCGEARVNEIEKIIINPEIKYKLIGDLPDMFGYKEIPEDELFRTKDELFESLNGGEDEVTKV